MVTDIDIFLMANELASLSHGPKKKPFTWNEVVSHWAWLVQHREYIHPPKSGANPLVFDKAYTKRVLEITKEIRNKTTTNEKN